MIRKLLVLRTFRDYRYIGALSLIIKLKHDYCLTVVKLSKTNENMPLK